MINAIQKEVPEAHEASFEVPIGKNLVGVYLLIRDNLMELALLKLHLFFEIIIVQIRNMASINARILPISIILFIFKEVIFFVFFIFGFECLRVPIFNFVLHCIFLIKLLFNNI